MTREIKTVGVLIFPGFPMACLTSLIEPLRAANEILDTRVFSWKLVAETSDKVEASAGVWCDPDLVLSDASDLDYLLLLSSPNAAFINQSTPGQLRALHRHGMTLGAVSGAVFPLVRAGLGVSDALSVHWCYRTAFEAEFPEIAASDQVLEFGSRLVTASGSAAAFDLALHIIKSHCNETLATEVACWFQHPMMRGEGVRQTVPGIDIARSGESLPPLVAKAVEFLAARIDEPPSVSEIAEHLDISPRHVERLFKRATNLSPSHYFRRLRMDAARQIVLYSNDGVADVASAVGYGSVQVFSRHYKAAFGMSPTEDRKRINLFRVSSNRPLPST